MVVEYDPGGAVMFSRRTLAVWAGIAVLAGMFLMGQDTWPPPCTDSDGDGYGSPASPACPYPLLDCDDGDPDIHPGVAEGPYGTPTCSDGADNDCDGLVDDADPGCRIEPTGLIPDTGITKCYDTLSEIACPSPGEPFYGQDAQYTTNPMSYTVSPDGLTVADNVTGLVWQRYCEGPQPLWDPTYCESLDLAGYSDWRLPDVEELQGIVDYGRYNPAIDPNAFPDTGGGCYWSSSDYPLRPFWKWYAEFSDGLLSGDWPLRACSMRCVRGEAVPTSFTDNGDGTVTDETTGRMWQKEDDGQTRTWEVALAYCEGLSLAGHTDWRLPDVKELKNGPAILNSSSFWSSSTYAQGAGSAWAVTDLFVIPVDKTSAGLVRCVR